MREKLKVEISLRMAGLWARSWHLPVLLCLAGVLQWDVCYSQRLVQIQGGPLYRVKGYPISLSCNVSGFKGPAEQDFEFSVKLKKRPELEMIIISTRKAESAFARFGDRVAANEIRIERLSGSSVLLWINNLLEEDAGVFICHTPNTDGPYNGIYAADTTIHVIGDTLVASYSGPPSKSMSEGDSLQLECQVSSQTFQHTHLSVTWFLHDGKNDVPPRPIITLDKDLTLKPGAEFEDRYQSGHISMDKVEDTTYRLKMAQVQLSDNGKIYCQAKEWIQDPDRSWTLIAHKKSSACNVEIKLIEMAPEVGSFVAYMEASKGPLLEGDALEIRCSVKTQNLVGHFFSVTWLKNQKKMAQIGSSGVLTVFEDYKERESKGELRAVKASQMDYQLTIRSARAEDQGQYQCEIWQESRNEDGTFTKIQKQLSSSESMSITNKESSLAVDMVAKTNAVTEGDEVQITCLVSGFKGPLSVSWQQKKGDSSFSDVISLTHEGVMDVIGNRYRGRDVQTFHSPAGNFTLKIGAATLPDSGEYKCIVSEWTMQSNGVMKKTNSQSQQKAISVNSIDSQMRVVLRSRVVTIPIDSQTELKCSVTSPKVPLAMRWMFHPSDSSTPITILSIHHNGEITWGVDQRNYQLSIQVQDSNTQLTLTLRASRQSAGMHQCHADAYQNDVQKASKTSNPLAITVKIPDSTLTLSKPKPNLETTVNTDAKIECSVIKATTNTSRFTVTWRIESLMLLTMNLDAVVTYGPAAGIDLDQRIRMEVRQKKTFPLIIQKAMVSDSGVYQCEVEEWLQDPLGDWYSVKKMSVDTQLIVKKKDTKFKMDKTDTQLAVREGDQLMLNCSLDGVEADPTLRYSVSWFFNQNQSSFLSLVTYSHDGRLQYTNYDPELVGRLRFSSPAKGVFHLTIHRAIQKDSGRYYCSVTQYQQECKGEESAKASDKSGFTDVTVHLIENKLRVRKEKRSLNVTNLQVGFPIDCVIESRSSDRSVFEVTWSRAQSDVRSIRERPVIIFNASRDGTLHSAISDRDLVFGRPNVLHYILTVPFVGSMDTGLYHCQVVEWIPTTTNNWRKIGEGKSGGLFVFVDTEDKQKEDSFTMDRTDKHLNITEGKQFELECSIDIGQEDPTIHYTLSWLFDSLESESSVPLLTYTYNGRLQYQMEYVKDRLHFSRPDSSTFHLTVLNSETTDSGNYKCFVEKHQLSCEGKWTQKASAQSGSTTVNVSSIESKLHVKKENRTVNITSHQTFTIDCVIKSRSSDNSAFKVTWFRGQREGPIAIFTAHRDGTLHNTHNDKDLLFGHPSPTLYKLTVPNISPTDMGQYHCQVEEWLPTTANSWKKVASDKSGELSVHVHTEGDTAKQTDSTAVMMGITFPLICLLALVIILLLRREHKRKSEEKKKRANLWPENNPLKPIPENGEDLS